MFSKRMDNQFTRFCESLRVEPYFPVTDAGKRNSISKMDTIWRWPNYRPNGLPDQGFKLHVTATPINALPIAKRVLPTLIDRGKFFKIVSNLRVLMRLNRGIYGLTQVGKFITVYPLDVEDAKFTGDMLHRLTARFAGPRVFSDTPLRLPSVIYYRYGAFRSDQATASSKSLPGKLIDPRGRIRPDSRLPGESVPPWVDDELNPNQRATTRPPRPPAPNPGRTTQLFAGRFVLLDTLRRRGGGGVFRAVDMSPFLMAGYKQGASSASMSPPLPDKVATKCIIKQAHKHGEVDFTGTDAIQRVLWEAKLLEEFRDIAYFPKLRGSFEHCGDHFLVLEALRGRSLLNRLVAGENFSVPQVLTIGVQLCKALQCVHSAGVILRDLSADNLLIGDDWRIWLIDLEHAYRSDGPPLTSVGTPLFCPDRHLKAVDRPPQPGPSIDLFSCGALLHTMLMPKWYLNAIEKLRLNGDVVGRPRLPPRIPIALRCVIEKSLHKDHRKRFRSATRMLHALKQSPAT